MSNDDSHAVDRRTLLKATGAAGATAALGGVVQATPGREPGPKEDEILVGVSAGNDLVGTVDKHVPGNAEVVESNDTLRFVAVKFPDEAADVARQNFVDAVTRDPNVKYAEKNATHTASLTPNDPEFGNQFAPQQVDAPTAWDTTQGSSDVTLAVVDTGAQYTHPDLDANFRSNPGRDFADGDQDPAPDVPADEFHGTHVSGIVGAATDNGTGVAGISDCTLINGRALDETGSGSTSDIANAIQWAADEGAEAVNLSLGGGGFTQTMKNAVSYAVNNGCQPIAAAGNAGQNSVDFPAAYSESLAVSAVDSNENIASFSNTGSDVELAAPGVDVLSTTTQTRGSYERLSGTSMATPVVTGVAGLVESVHGDLTPTQLRNHLKGTASPISGLTTDEQGCGQVNAANAVNTAPANRSTNCANGGGGGGGGGNCGANSTNGSVTSSLSSSFDSDCWTWGWQFSDPCEVEIELDGAFGTDFDLYVNDGEARCPGPNDFDARSISPDSQETVTISNPDTSTDLFILVDSFSGSGSYTLTVTERST